MKLNTLKPGQFKKAKYFSLFLVLFSLFFLSSCDKFNSLPLNIPYRIHFFVSGSGAIGDSTASFCPDESTTYQQYQDKIKSLSYVQAAITIDSLSSTSLSVDIQIQIKGGSGNILLTQNITGFKPSDYMNKAYVIKLTQNQIIALNNYLKNLTDNCFQVSIKVSGFSGTQYVGGHIDLVLEADTKL
jgi:hypothetical protein